jgi:hypothetical protein
MQLEYDYYIVEGDGPVRTAIETWRDACRKFHEHKMAVLAKFKGSALYAGDFIVGVFYEAPALVPAGFMHKADHPDGVYAPDKRTTPGKEIAKELRAVTMPTIHDLGRWAKGHPIMSGSFMCWPTFEQIGDTFVWLVPLDPSGEERAQEDTTGLRIIKTSEYWALKEANAA